jgi:flavin reductase (DIM6/NTAB) family NADH-FMN oxidoreductase RutF
MTTETGATSGATRSDLEARSLRKALSSLPTGVVVVTACDAQAGRLGMTMNSFTSVSLEPPLVMFSIDRRALALPAWLRAPGYAVNVLASNQEQLSNQFARALGDKWKGVRSTPGLHAAPLLEGAVARFECSAHQTFDGGDHVVFLVRIERYTCDESAAPLVFHRGRYGVVSTSWDASMPPPGWPLSIHY